MSILSAAGKDAGLSAAQELHKTAGDLLDKLDNQTIPAADAAIKDATDHATYSLAGLVADIANRLNGAELPVDIQIHISIAGRVGALKISNPVVMEAQPVEVQG